MGIRASGFKPAIAKLGSRVVVTVQHVAAKEQCLQALDALDAENEILARSAINGALANLNPVEDTEDVWEASFMQETEDLPPEPKPVSASSMQAAAVDAKPPPRLIPVEPKDDQERIEALALAGAGERKRIKGLSGSSGFNFHSWLEVNADRRRDALRAPLPRFPVGQGFIGIAT